MILLGFGELRRRRCRRAVSCPSSQVRWLALAWVISTGTFPHTAFTIWRKKLLMVARLPCARPSGRPAKARTRRPARMPGGRRGRGDEKLARCWSGGRCRRCRPAGCRPKRGRRLARCSDCDLGSGLPLRQEGLAADVRSARAGGPGAAWRRLGGAAARPSVPAGPARARRRGPMRPAHPDAARRRQRNRRPARLSFIESPAPVSRPRLADLSGLAHKQQRTRVQPEQAKTAPDDARPTRRGERRGRRLDWLVEIMADSCSVPAAARGTGSRRWPACGPTWSRRPTSCSTRSTRATRSTTPRSSAICSSRSCSRRRWPGSHGARSSAASARS